MSFAIMLGHAAPTVCVGAWKRRLLANEVVVVLNPAEGGFHHVTVLIGVDPNVFAERMLMNVWIADVGRYALIRRSEMSVLN